MRSRLQYKFKEKTNDNAYNKKKHQILIKHSTRKKRSKNTGRKSRLDWTENDWMEAIESGKSVLAVFLNVERALDSVHNSELLNQLKIVNLALSITT